MSDCGTAESTTRSVAWCSASIWSAPDGSALLTSEASSIWSDPDLSSRIVWMIKRMIKAHPTQDRMARRATPDAWWTTRSAKVAGPSGKSSDAAGSGGRCWLVAAGSPGSFPGSPCASWPGAQGVSPAHLRSCGRSSRGSPPAAGSRPGERGLRGPGSRPRWPMGGLAAVEGLDVGVGAVVEAGRVGIPEPDVQGHQVRVPEVEGGAGLGAALGALILGPSGHERPVLVVARRRERPIGRARQRRGGWLLGEDPLERSQLPAASVALVDQDRGRGDVEALDGRVEEVPAHVGDHPGDD